MVKNNIKKMFRIIKKRFMRLLTGIVQAPSHTKCVSLSN